MRAIEISTPGGPEVLVPTSRPVPEAGRGEVLIKVEAAGINRPDVFQRMGQYAPPPGTTDLPGLEVAGEIVLNQYREVVVDRGGGEFACFGTHDVSG